MKRLAVVIPILLVFLIGWQPVSGQIDSPNSPTAESNQCMDFDNDNVCEYILLTNGTMVKNPEGAADSVTTESDIVEPESADTTDSIVNDENLRNTIIPNAQEVNESNLELIKICTASPNSECDETMKIIRNDCAAYPDYIITYVPSCNDSRLDSYFAGRESVGGSGDGVAGKDEEEEGEYGEEDTGPSTSQPIDRYYEGMDWRRICGIPMVAERISQPCDTMITSDGNALTAIGKQEMESELCPEGPSVIGLIEFAMPIPDHLETELAAACGW